MVKTELIGRSPLRILEQSTNGGLGKGNIGVIASRKGVGKTACLVNIASDLLLQEKRVIHVSFSEKTDHIIAWYEDIFSELADRFKLENTSLIHDNIIKNRIIMSFVQDNIHQEKIENSIRTIIEKGAFSANTIVIDGYDFNKSSIENLLSFRKFASEFNIELWCSASIPDKPDYFNGAAIPELLQPFINEISIVICLQPQDHLIHLNLVKDHDSDIVENPYLKLDPKILLIAEELK